MGTAPFARRANPARNSRPAPQAGSLKDYNTVLNKRAEMLSDVSQLHGQNEELKGLLNQYLGAKVVDELLIPPTQVIRLDR